MKRIYITYTFTLLSAIIVFELFSIVTSTFYSYGWVGTSALVSQLQFGLSSWLFLHFPKGGKILAILTTLIMCIWPIDSFVKSIMRTDWNSSVIYLIPIVLSGVVVSNHIKYFNDKTKPSVKIRVMLTVIPLGFFLFEIASRFNY